MKLTCTLLFLLPLVAISKCLPTRGCPGGWAKGNFWHPEPTYKCYKVFRRSESEWESSEFTAETDACVKEGGMLASIHSGVENDFVTRLALNAVFADIPGSLVKDESSRWSYLAVMGGVSDQKEWTDGSRFQYSNVGDQQYQIYVLNSPRTNLFVQLNPRAGDGRSRFGTWTSYVEISQFQNSTRLVAVVCQLVVGPTDPVVL